MDVHGNRNSISVVIAGSGGAGAMTAGELLIQAAASAGYYATMSKLFGPQVIGGESAALVQLATAPVRCAPDRFDVFVALDWEKVEQFAPEVPLGPASIVIADLLAGPVPAAIAKTLARTVDFAMETGSTKAVGRHRGGTKNVFMAGVLGTLVGLGEAHLKGALVKHFDGKDPAMVQRNAAALDNGIAAGRKLDLDLRLAAPIVAPRWLITGNQATALGALRGGVRFVGCYPITPATDLVEWLAPQIQRLGGRLVLAEDELASINMVLGASFAGVPAMTVTSGPGLSLMCETIGLAVAAEVPAVIVDVMRGGPSTGIPSKSEQSDVDLALYGSHGDAPRIVLAPTSVRDCLFTTEWAVYLAESLQSPVIVLTDQALGQEYAVIDPKSERPKPLHRRTDFKEGAFKRYALEDGAVSPMPRPGTPGGQWVGEGLTHNEMGIPVSASTAHVAQIRKRARKISSFDPGDLWGEVWGDGSTAILAFGSSIGPAQEAARRLTEAGQPTRVVGLRVLSPLPVCSIADALYRAERVVVLEQNQGAQLYHHLMAHKAIPRHSEPMARPGPLPFRAAEIEARFV